MAKSQPTPAAKLKNILDGRFVEQLASELQAAHPQFDAKRFTRASRQGLEELELTPRAWHVAEALHQYLPQPFPRAAEVLIRSLRPELADTESLGLSPLQYLPHVFYVQKYGLDHFEPAMALQRELTKRFSAESSIRAFLVRHPEATYARLQQWALDPNVHVRRLVSEGTRPRLPWAPRLRAFQQDPRPVLELLELLKDDSERYVQRSVANNLNDIAKDHPDLVLDTCERWNAGASTSRAWIIRHGLRSLIKQAAPRALALVGAGKRARVEIEAVRLTPPRPKLGETVRFEVALRSISTREQDLLVDYVVHFVKFQGHTRPKVFKLKRLLLEPKSRTELRGKISFAPMTTRQHYPGTHRLELLVNGAPYPLTTFELRR
ncbi:MAG TPA: DNA alkylation repair protein [Polyangiaceae bacterium]|nr:DNA alkylation repair protein [Polyangiaceae bacterium]